MFRAVITAWLNASQKIRGNVLGDMFAREMSTILNSPNDSVSRSTRISKPNTASKTDIIC